MPMQCRRQWAEGSGEAFQAHLEAITLTELPDFRMRKCQFSAATDFIE